MLKQSIFQRARVISLLAVMVSAACIQSGNDKGWPSVTGKVVTACEENEETVPLEAEFGLPGTLSYQFMYQIHLLGGEPLTDRILNIEEGTNPSLVGFSPNGKWLAYHTGSVFDGIPKSLHLVDGERNTKSVTPPADELVRTQPGNYVGEWGNMLWVNDRMILVHLDNSNEVVGLQFILALLDPFTGQWQHALMEGLQRSVEGGGMAFSPDLSRVLYMSDLSEEGPSVIRLWDLVANKELWQHERRWPGTSFTYASDGWVGSARWSPDSRWIAFTEAEYDYPEDRSLPDIDRQGVYLLDRDGLQGRLITDFRTRYEGRYFTTYGLSWSPDGRYLAFGVGVSEPGTYETPYRYRLYLYDHTDDKLIDLCWLRGDDNTFASTSGAFVWSPDSQYIAYIAQYANPLTEEEAQYPPTLMVINIYTGEVRAVVEGRVKRLGGWSGQFSP